MDLFVFPSQTDAFGNVVLEAMSSGVPAVVMREGGPKFLIKHGENGFVAEDETDFIETVVGCSKIRIKSPTSNKPPDAPPKSIRGNVFLKRCLNIIKWAQAFEKISARRVK